MRRFMLKGKDNTFRGEGVEWFTGGVTICLGAVQNETPKYLQFSGMSEAQSVLHDLELRALWLEQFHTVPPR